MDSDDRESVQLTFQDGSLVERPPDTGESTGGRDGNPVEPGEETGFTVEVKAGALEVNEGFVEVVDSHGRQLEFGPRAHAETYARQLSVEGGDLRLQAAAPNDPNDVDGYLLAAHDPSIKEPAEVEGATWTFDVGANLYGALGEAILLEAPRPHALYYFVRQDLDLDDLESGLNLDVRSGSVVSFGEDRGDSRTNWVPDCTVVARDEWDGPVLEQYYCEIKTGDASFERSQVAAMEQFARDERVLKIRMLVEELPDQYSLRIHEVEPPD